MTRRTAAWAGAAAAFTVVSGVAVNQVLEDGRIRWPWLAAAVAVTAIGGILASLVRGPAAADPPGADAPALDALADTVRAVWKPEERHRRLLHPHPLPTAWTTIGPPVADHWANIRADGIDRPLALDGVVDPRRPDSLQEVVADPRLRGRVVILGEPGAGKTALLLRLTLALLETRADDAELPVPVLLRLSTWDPDTRTLEQWITGRLLTDYGHRRPLPLERLLPLLDGLDEMPAPRRCRALLALTHAFTPGAPLVLTSRTSEYLDTLADLTGRVLPATAVLELTPLPHEAVRDFLTLSTTAERPGGWANVLARDAEEHRGRLASALAEPLWVDLARTTHDDPDRAGHDSTDLLGLPDAAAVHAHLLDRLIPAAYPDPPEPAPDGRIWRCHDAQRWLGELATDMSERGTQDLAWWELTRSLSRPVRTLVGLALWLVIGLPTWFVTLPLERPSAFPSWLAAGLSAGFGMGPVVGLFVGLGSEPVGSRRRSRDRPLHRALAVSLAFGLTFGLAFALVPMIGVPLLLWVALWLAVGLGGVFGGGLGSLPLPSRRRIRWRRTGRPLVRRLAEWFAFGSTFTVAFVAAGVLWAGLTDSLPVADWLAAGYEAGLFGFAFGMVFGFVGEFTTFFQEGDADVPAATDPVGLLRDDRRRVLVVGLTSGLVFGLASGNPIAPPAELPEALRSYLGSAVSHGVGFGLAAGLTYGLIGSAWGQLQVARLWWCARGRLPWRVMSFLRDAHRRGVLRQAGGVWQFRHALLRDRIAATRRGSPR
ncbi:NACHT domain-containing protein [Cryptosporangium aurantiacum]|uniref:NACHT domain-containing protein n=1 Tax=Cryptosporangium aurantiacum TaxID=134849 RepID=UPI0015B9745B|nr:NACHT domain-containing protein [Cryptosporangium aurantiacum]